MVDQALTSIRSFPACARAVERSGEMAKTRQRRQQSVEDLLRDIMIVQLALAGIGQHQIREIVGVDMYRVSRIAKHIKKAKE